ncbi:MAG: nucleotidyl transferase AbiEii/AbiGii toxin family protein [Spirochaetaceae bacterium]
MSLFDTLVDQVLQKNQELMSLRPVVEKEILHHDILREMAHAGFLRNLTFIGGTCLRDCYGSPRLSEDLDFTGGTDFDPDNLKTLAAHLEEAITKRYGLEVRVDKPHRTEGDTKTWKVKIITRPEQAHLPSQRIHIDVCAVSSFETQPMMLRNPYGVDFGTSGLILHAETREEIFSDKLVALALRPNRIKQRDIWDIIWMTQHTVALRPDLVRKKLTERQVEYQQYLELFSERIERLRNGHSNFLFEIRRFLPAHTVDASMETPEYWSVVISTLKEIYSKL